MVAKQERIKAWFNLATDMMSETSWQLATASAEASLSHRFCPWGGYLVKLDFRNILISGAPERSENVMVRPEVRGQSHDRWFNEFQVNWITTIAPGDAVVEQTSTPSTLRLASLLFGDLAGHFMNHFFPNKKPVFSRHQLRRDFPEAGDCMYVSVQDGQGIGQGVSVICRREHEAERERFRTIVVFSTERWAAWASPAFPLFTTGARKAFQWFLNRPGLQEMRSIDSNFYVLLAIRSFNRGPPMLPQAEPDTQSISIAAGEELGFPHWARFRNGGRQFRFAEYLRRFLEKLGHVVEIYETMEGRELVPYQCVLVRSQWEEVREPCLQLLNVQKAAYRRANGGKTSPSLIEDAPPRFASEHPVHDDLNETSQESLVASLATCKTFIELDEEKQDPCCPRKQLEREADCRMLCGV